MRDHGLLRARGTTEPPQADDEVDVARYHHQVRVDVSQQLGVAACGGCHVCAACVWTPDETRDWRLYPDVVVHRPLGSDHRLPAPPALCVDMGTGPADRRSVSAYARLGVDHHWHLDLEARVVEVSVRVDDDYRRAETLPLDDTGQWIDFGVGIVWLTLPLNPREHRALGRS